MMNTMPKIVPNTLMNTETQLHKLKLMNTMPNTVTNMIHHLTLKFTLNPVNKPLFESFPYLMLSYPDS